MHTEMKGRPSQPHPLPLIRDNVDVVRALERIKKFHLHQSQDQIAACDDALARYFTVLRVRSVVNEVFKNAEYAVFKNLAVEYPVSSLDLFTLPLPRTQAILGDALERIAATRQISLRVINEVGTAFMNAVANSTSLFASSRYQQLCEVDQTSESIAERQGDFAVYYELLLAADTNAANRLSQLNLAPMDLFCFFRFVGLHYPESHLIPVVFAAIREATIDGRFQSLPAHEEFIRQLAIEEPCLYALLAKDADRVEVITRDSVDNRLDQIKISRFLLAAHSDYFAYILRADQVSQWVSGNKDGVPIVDLSKTQVTSQILVSLIYGTLPKTPRMTIFPRKDADAAVIKAYEDTSHAYVSEMRSLCSFCNKHWHNDIQHVLVDKLCDEKLIPFLTLGLQIPLPILLKGCINYLNVYHGDMLHIMCLPTGGLKLRLSAWSSKVPGCILKAVEMLAEKATYLTVQTAMANPPARGVLKTIRAGLGALTQPREPSLRDFIDDAIGYTAFPAETHPVLTTLDTHPGFGSQLTILDFTYSPDIKDAHLLHLMKRCPKVHTLKLDTNNPLTARSLSKLHRFQQLSRMRLTIRKNDMGPFNAINFREQFANEQTLHVELFFPDDGDKKGGPEPIFGSTLCQRIPLFYRNLHAGIELSAIIESVNELRSLIAFTSWMTPSPLTSLSLRKADKLFAGDWTALVNGCPQLRQVHAVDLNQQAVEALATLRCLRSLSIARSASVVNDQQVLSLAAGLPNLESLDILSRSQISDISLRRLAMLPHLQRFMVVQNRGVTDEGVRFLLERHPTLELTLLGVAGVSTQFLGQTSVKTMSAETVVAQAPLLRMLQSAVQHPSVYNESDQQVMQQAVHILLDMFLDARCLLDLPWPYLRQMAAKMGCEHWMDLVPQIADANLENFQSFVQGRLKLQPISEENRNITVNLAHLQLLAQTIRDWSALPSHGQFLVRELQSAFAKSVRQADIGLLNLFPSLFSRSQSVVLNAFVRTLPGLIRNALNALIKASKGAAPLDYRHYLRVAFPKMNQSTIDRLFEDLTQRMHDRAGIRAKDIAAIGLAFPTGGLQVLHDVINLLSDPMWKFAYSRFLDQVAIEAAKPENRWTDKQKLALALGGLLNFGSLLPMLKTSLEQT